MGFYKVKIKYFIKNSPFSFPNLTFTKWQAAARNSWYNLNNFFLFWILVMFIKWIEVLNKIWMIKLKERLSKLIRNNNIIIISDMLVIIKWVSFLSSHLNTIQHIHLDRIVRNFINIVTLAFKEPRIKFHSSNRFNP